MTQNYYTVRLNCSLQPLVEKSKRLFRDHHKDFRGVPISNSKIMLEALLFYLKGTKYEVKNDIFQNQSKE